MRSTSRLTPVLASAMVLGAAVCARAGAAGRSDPVINVEPVAEGLRQMIDRARDGVFPSLVNISVVTVRYWNGRAQKGRSTGSGTIISPDGYVLTNQHVTFNGKEFRCTLADRQEVRATLVGEDPLTDLAVLRLDKSDLKDPAAPLPVANFGDSSELRVGDYVMAMGSPLALSRSVTLGIVSNVERIFAGGMGIDQDDMQLEEGQRTGLFTRWIQHDALINPGNSGGPLVNMRGEVVGVNELGGAAIGFAIPSNLAREVADALIRHGQVPRSWIGVSLRPIQKTGLKRGVLVNSVVENGPAARAGLRAGDVIIRLEDEPVTARFPEELPGLMKRLADPPAGSTLRLTYERDGKSVEASVVTEKLQNDRGEETALRAWGLTVLEITDFLARRMKLDSKRGAVVSSVRSGGPAALAEPAISDGDVVVTVEGESVADLAELAAVYERTMSSKPRPEYVAIGFERKGRQYVTLLKPLPESEEDPPREVPKAWVGIAVQPVLKELARRLGHPDSLGFRVTRVYPGTNADRAGLKVGDVVLGVNGERLQPRGIQDAGLLDRLIRRMAIGDQATLTVLRDGRTQEVALALEQTRLTPAEARREINRDFEMGVRELTFFDRDENRWSDSVSGVIVQQAESAGWAGLAGVRAGDLLQRVGDYEIREPGDFRKAMKKIAESQPERVVFVVLRGVETRFLFAEPNWKATPQTQPAVR